MEGYVCIAPGRMLTFPALHYIRMKASASESCNELSFQLLTTSIMGPTRGDVAYGQLGMELELMSQSRSAGASSMSISNR